MQAPASPLSQTDSRSKLRVDVASGDTFDVREFNIHQVINGLFSVTLIARCDNAVVDFTEIIGASATFTLEPAEESDKPVQSWTGVCNEIEQIAAEEDGLSTYHLSIVPSLWLLSQKRDYRIFQQMTEPQIVLKILAEWGIEPTLELDARAYKERKYRVQYGESDFAFVSRLLEDAGISYFFRDQGGQTVLVLSDAPQRVPSSATIPFCDDVSAMPPNQDYATRVQVKQRLRPGKYTICDHDYRRSTPQCDLTQTSEDHEIDVEARFERRQYRPGIMLYRSPELNDTEVADSDGRTRADQSEGAALARRRLEAKRAKAKTVTLETNVYPLRPGSTFAIEHHPRPDIEGTKLLVVSAACHGTFNSDWTVDVEAVDAAAAFRPALSTPKPEALGVESATVVGPKGEEIYCDEFGRVKVHFHWDRESEMDERSSCWIHVNQAWGGAGFGGVHLPRVGQEVLVGFLCGDPDRPVIVGRVYTQTQQVPYKLPENKTQSGIRSQSTGGGDGHNEFMVEDKKGQELMRIHAERDEQVTVKHDGTRTVGGNQTINIGGTLVVQVGGTSVEVVNETRTTVVQQSISNVSLSGSITFACTAGVFAATGDSVLMEADKVLCLKVGESEIILTKAGIIIDGPQVLINPGADVKATFLATGKTPNQIEEERLAQQQGAP